AVWTGIGAAGTAIAGMLWLGESRDPLNILSLLMLIAGLIGLRGTSGEKASPALLRSPFEPRGRPNGAPQNGGSRRSKRMLTIITNKVSGKPMRTKSRNR